MLTNLLESNARPQRRRAGSLASVAIHTCIIGAVAVATAGGRETSAPRVERPPSIIFVPPSEQPTTPTTPNHRAVNAAPSVDGVTKVPDLDIRVDLSKVPTGPPDPSARLADPGAGEPGPRTTSLLPGGRSDVISPTPYTEATVDKPARLRGVVTPRYPERLRAAGISGRVLVRFIIDTTGRVEPTSVTILESDHDAMADAVRGVIPKLRFDPAEVSGVRVRMLGVMPFEFSLR